MRYERGVLPKKERETLQLSLTAAAGVMSGIFLYHDSKSVQYAQDVYRLELNDPIREIFAKATETFFSNEQHPPAYIRSYSQIRARSLGVFENYIYGKKHRTNLESTPDVVKDVFHLTYDTREDMRDFFKYLKDVRPKTIDAEQRSLENRYRRWKSTDLVIPTPVVRQDAQPIKSLQPSLPPTQEVFSAGNETHPFNGFSPDKALRALKQREPGADRKLTEAIQIVTESRMQEDIELEHAKALLELNPKIVADVLTKRWIQPIATEDTQRISRRDAIVLVCLNGSRRQLSHLEAYGMILRADQLIQEKSRIHQNGKGK
jgi:hypothetical protein